MSSPETVKVVLLGEAGVGKTCIISQFISGVFDPDTISSLSAQFITKNMELKNIKKVIKFDIWDTAGQERFRALAKIFYKDAKVICLVYDITSKKTFEELKEFWYEQQTKLNVDGEPIFAVVANKNDLYEIQQVKDEEGKEFAKSINAIFQSTSAKSDSGITNLFENIGYRYFDPNFDTNEIENKEKMEYEKKKRENAEKKTQNQIQSRGVKLDTNKTKQRRRGCC
jgi:small GTP-binding protein